MGCVFKDGCTDYKCLMQQVSGCMWKSQSMKVIVCLLVQNHVS